MRMYYKSQPVYFWLGFRRVLRERAAVFTSSCNAWHDVCPSCAMMTAMDAFPLERTCLLTSRALKTAPVIHTRDICCSTDIDTAHLKGEPGVLQSRLSSLISLTRLTYIHGSKHHLKAAICSFQTCTYMYVV